MKLFTREESRQKPLIGQLFAVLKSRHEIPDYLQATLQKNNQKKYFCVQVRFFKLLDSLMVHYDTDNWFRNSNILVVITSVALYDSYKEYESARVKQLQSVNPQTNSEGSNLN